MKMYRIYNSHGGICKQSKNLDEMKEAANLISAYDLDLVVSIFLCDSKEDQFFTDGSIINEGQVLIVNCFRGVFYNE